MRDDSYIDLEPTCWVRNYCGEYATHMHSHAQIIFALDGRLELEIAGHQTFSDTSCGIIIPAGVDHAFLAPNNTRMFGFDAPNCREADRVRRFPVTPELIALRQQRAAAVELEAILNLPRVLNRRGIDLDRLASEVGSALHESWPTARIARIFCLSVQRFHARLIELTGLTPQAYVRNLRLDHAEACLREGLSLDITARAVGYCSASALGFALKRDRRVGARSLRR